MLGLTLESLWARRRRSVGTAIAVVIGVAFLMGTLMLGDTLRTNFDRLFTQVSAKTDVVVRNATETSDEPDATRGLIDASLVDTVRDVPGVAHAEAQVMGYGTLLGRDGDAIGGNGPPRLAGSWITDPSLNPYRLVEGRAPRGPREVVINRGAADAGDLAVGDTTTLQAPDPVTVHVVGIATFGDEDGMGETTFTALTLRAAQDTVTRDPGHVSSILVRAEPGVDPNALRRDIADALPSGVQAITGRQLADEQLDQLAFLDILRALLVVFAGIALVVAMLTINNAFSITLAQRTRELALLRAVGGSRRQLRTSVAIEAGAIGVVAAVLGVAGGFAVATGLKAMFEAFGGALPAGGLTVRPFAVGVSVAVGILLPVIAAQLPARRAATVSPMAMLRESQHESSGGLARRGVIGGGLLAGGVAVGVAAVLGGGPVGVALAAAVLLIAGTFVVAPVLVGPAATVAGSVLAKLRGANGRFAAQNARRNPRRSATTATALVVGVAVVSLITVLVASLKTTLDRDIDTAFRADLVVNTEFFGGSQLSPRVIDALRATPEVRQAVGVAETPVLLGGTSTTVTAIDVDAIDDVTAARTVSGTFHDVGADGLAVDHDKADAEHWKVGTPIEVTFSDGSTERLTVRAVYAPNTLLGDVVMPTADWLEHTAQPTLRRAFVTVAPGVSTAAARHAIQPIAQRYGAEVQDREQYSGAATGGLDLLLGVVYVLLALAVVIALLGIANTLSLAVYERRREIGLLRAIGETRRQVRSTLRLESVILAGFGTVVGLALGAFLGWVLFGATSDDGRFSLPIGLLLAIAAVGCVAGVVAAWRPARRAARVGILEAIAAT
jgi:putative ABC transport system permease protein